MIRRVLNGACSVTPEHWPTFTPRIETNILRRGRRPEHIRPVNRRLRQILLFFPRLPSCSCGTDCRNDSIKDSPFPPSDFFRSVPGRRVGPRHPGNSRHLERGTSPRRDGSYHEFGSVFPGRGSPFSAWTPPCPYRQYRNSSDCRRGRSSGYSERNVHKQGRIDKFRGFCARYHDPSGKAVQ